MAIETLPVAPAAAEIAGGTPPGEYALGKVVNRAPILPAQAPEFHIDIGKDEALWPREIRIYDIKDPYVEYLEHQKPGRSEEILEAEEAMSGFAKARRLERKWNRLPGTAYIDTNGESHDKKVGFGDPGSREEFFAPGSLLGDPALMAWRETIPDATALEPLVNPYYVKKIRNRNGQLVDATEDTRDWMTVCHDAWEIRNRGTIAATEEKEFLLEYVERHPDEKIVIISVAGGTLLPALQGAINSGLDERIKIILLEQNPESRAMAESFKQKLGFRGELEMIDIDVFDRQAMSDLADRLEAKGEKAAFTDAMGITEYSDFELANIPKVGERFKAQDTMLIDPVAFIQAVGKLGKPGGRQVFGQMRKDRPHDDFTFGVVCWPWVCMRSPAELMKLFAGANMDPKSIRLSMTPRKLYTVATRDIPEEGELGGMEDTIEDVRIAGESLLRRWFGSGFRESRSNRRSRRAADAFPLGRLAV